MTYQSGMRTPQHGESLPYETKIPQDTLHENKRALLIGKIFDRILDLTTDSRGLVPVAANYEDFDLDTVLMPHHHRPGYIREARFQNGLWIRATTKDPIVDKLHNLLILDGQHIYKEQMMRVHGEPDAEPIELAGVDDIALLPSVEYDLGIIEERIERERADHWAHALSPGDLRVAWNAKRNLAS